MFNLFKKENENKKNENHLSLISIAALLIHSAKIDENFTEKERSIIKKALILQSVYFLLIQLSLMDLKNTEIYF